ncbi:MAG: ferric reductase-like transmembrane domain-containing protein [Parcubacteria group bacterium]|nr:ferric reductase-like transmembrane domain-containing protein [Parcubacteria group bacterium]
MEETKLQTLGGWKTTVSIFVAVFLISFVYAFIRYNILRDVSLGQIPFFITNKVLALTGTILIGFSFLLGPLTRFWPRAFERKLYLRKPLGVFGFGIAALHSFISLALLSPAYYPKFFLESGKLNFIGETSLLFGVLALFIFSVVSLTSIPAIAERLKPEQWKSIQRLGYLAYVFVLLHVVVMGFQGWFLGTSYLYGFISISLISALFIITVLIFRLAVIVFPKRDTEHN